MSSLKYLGGSALEPPRPFHDAARRLAAAGLSAALARLSRRLGRRVASSAVGSAAAALAAIYPMLFLSEATLMSESLYVMLVTLLLLF